MEIGIRQFFLEGHAAKVARAPHDVAPNAARLEWERNFRIALGAVPEPFSVHVVWLANGHGVIEIHDEKSKANQLVEYWVIDPTDDEPARMAYATMPYFQHDAGAGGANKTWSETDLRAMQEPKLWIDGGTLPG
jgi:hypothetical protein